MRIEDLELTPYREAMELQLQCVEKVAAGGEPRLLLVEHPPVVTLGRRGALDGLLVSRETLRARGVELVHATRGGDVTCHFPGQLVAYPILRLAKRPGGVRAFFHDLEEAVLQTLAEFSLAAHRREGLAGVWIERRKIASMGVAVKRWVTHHGLALNVARDVSLFELIHPCGMPDAAPTSMAAELDDDSITVAQVKHVLISKLQALFAHPAVAAHQPAP